MNDVTLPFHNLVNKLEDKQNDILGILKAFDNFNKEKKPIEELITSTENMIDNLEPFILDIPKGQKQCQELEVSKQKILKYFFYYYGYALSSISPYLLIFFFLKEHLLTLEKRKPELRGINRVGQSLIRQLPDPTETEKLLDNLSDKYFEVMAKTKEKSIKQKDTLTKVIEFVTIIEELEVWAEEIYEVINLFNLNATDPEGLKKQLQSIEVRKNILMIFFKNIS